MNLNPFLVNFLATATLASGLLLIAVYFMIRKLSKT